MIAAISVTSFSEAQSGPGMIFLPDGTYCYWLYDDYNIYLGSEIMFRKEKCQTVASELHEYLILNQILNMVYFVLQVDQTRKIKPHLS